MLVYSLFSSLCICVRLVSLLSTKVVGEPLPELAEVLTDEIPYTSIIQLLVFCSQVFDFLIRLGKVLSKVGFT